MFKKNQFRSFTNIETRRIVTLNCNSSASDIEKFDRQVSAKASLRSADLREYWQKLVTKSSTEAELVAESDFASEAIYGTEFLLAQGEDVSPAIIHQVNMSTIAMIKNGVSKSDKTRHMNVRFFWTKERVDNGDIQILYTPTDDMIADILTKPLQGDKFLTLRRLLLNWNV
jgi:hypothetical protein